MDKMDKHKSGLRALRRFRAVVRIVILNKFWLTAVDDEDTELTGNVLQNVQKLKHRKKGYKALLTLEQKAMLNKPAENRTDVEKNILRKIIENLNCFRRYPRDVKEKLASVCYFVYYGPGRTIVRQNQASECLYFIITGNVGVYKTTYDELEDYYYEAQVGILSEGSMFGEVALLHDIPRQATIITLTDCEMLKMWKEDFNAILKATIQNKWDEIQAGLKLFKCFNLWTSMQIRECCIISKLRNYVPGNIILTGTVQPSNYVYFILRGQVQIIEQLKIVTTVDCKGVKHHSLYKKQVEFKDAVSLDSEESRHVSTQQVIVAFQNLERQLHTASHKSTTYPKSRSRLTVSQSVSSVATRFLQVCFLNVRGCFGLGELTGNRFIVASEHTTCLLIPRYFLLNNNTSNEWTRVKLFLQRHIPNTTVVFEQFIEHQKWRKYRKDLVDSIYTKPPVNSLSNVPYSIRLKEDFY